MLPYVVCQSTTLKQLHNEIDEIVKDYYLEQTHYVFMLGVLEFAQVA